MECRLHADSDIARCADRSSQCRGNLHRWWNNPSECRCKYRRCIGRQVYIGYRRSKAYRRVARWGSVQLPDRKGRRRGNHPFSSSLLACRYTGSVGSGRRGCKHCRRYTRCHRGVGSGTSPFADRTRQPRGSHPPPCSSPVGLGSDCARTDRCGCRDFGRRTESRRGAGWDTSPFPDCTPRGRGSRQRLSNRLGCHDSGRGGTGRFPCIGCRRRKWFRRGAGWGRDPWPGRRSLHRDNRRYPCIARQSLYIALRCSGRFRYTGSNRRSPYRPASPGWNTRL